MSSINVPGRYMAPVLMSIFMYMRPCPGLTLWKYPRQSTIPDPMLTVSRSVKKLLTLKGQRIVGSWRTTTFRAYTASILSIRILLPPVAPTGTYRDRCQDFIVMALFAL